MRFCVDMNFREMLVNLLQVIKTVLESGGGSEWD